MTALLASSYNVDTLILCPQVKGQINILRESIANAQYIALRDFPAMKHLPDAIPGDTFNVTLYEGANEKVKGLAKIDYTLNNLFIDNDAKQTVLDFPKLDSKDDDNKCAIW